MTRVGIIISSFNRAALLHEALESLQTLLSDPALSVQVVVYDAGSTDGSLRVLDEFRGRHSRGRMDVLVPEPGEDTSFSAGLNRACAFAVREYGVQHLFLFETDNLITGSKPVKRALFLLDSDKQIAAVGFTVRRRDGRRAGFGERFPRPLSLILGQQVSTYLRLHDARVSWLDGNGPVGRFGYSDVVYTSPLVIRAAAWQAVGGMDARVFPFSDSDLDLAFRFHQKGYRCAVLDESGVVHDNCGCASEWSATRTLRWHAARFRLLRRYSGVGMLAAVPLLFVRHLLEWCILCMKSSPDRASKLKTRVHLLRAVWRGYAAPGLMKGKGHF
jgi:GT2 family glycosyltransferase